MTDITAAQAGSTVRPEWAVPDDSAPTESGADLGKDEFLQLLVAQLKYQDPLAPQSSDEFISTTAQFTTVEKLDELTKQGANTALITSLTTAGSLVGREVTSMGDNGPETSIVLRSRLSNGQVMLETDRGDLALEAITSVGGFAGANPAVTSPAADTTTTTDVEVEAEADADAGSGITTIQ